MAGQMKVGLIGESVTMHYLDYYCETHKDRIAGFSDVRDDKKYQEDDIDFVVYRKDGSSFTVEAKADTYKTGNVFLETAVNSFAIGEDDKLLRFGKYQKAIAKHSKGWLYKEVTHVASYHVEVTPMSNNYEAMGFAFTHQGLKEYEKSIDNHIFYPCRCYAHAGEKYSREAGDFYPIMEFLHSAGEQLLREDIRRYDIKPAVIRTKEEMHEFYRTQPDEMILAALVEVDDKVTGKRYCSIRVWCSGHEVKTRSMGSYYVLNKHYLTVNKDDMVATYPYPFSCDDGANTLLEAKDTDILTPVERLFLWTEYKNPNPIDTKKK